MVLWTRLASLKRGKLLKKEAAPFLSVASIEMNKQLFDKTKWPLMATEREVLTANGLAW